MTTMKFIENNLLPAFQIEGQNTPKMTLAERMSYHNVPGVSIAVINNGEIEWAKGYGEVEAGGSKPVNTSTLFQAASISKPVSALAAMALVQQGLLDLDQDVNTVLKSWQVPPSDLTATEKVTLRRLLSHNAGLTVHGFPGYAEGEALPTVQHVLLGTPPANTPPVMVDVLPGSIWRYSGGGTTVAQLMMMEATGMDYASLMQKYVLGPAGMSLSTYEQPLPAGRRDEAATAHNDKEQPCPGKWHSYPEQAAAGLWTTPSDLCRYVIELQKSWHGQSNRILSQASTQEMLRVQFKDWGIGPKISGLGQAVSFSHGGANEGFRCEMMGFLHTGQGIAVMTNGDNGSWLNQEIIRSAALAFDWTAYLPEVKVTVEVPSACLQEYTGKYTFDEMPELPFEILMDDGSLYFETPAFSRTKTRLFAQSPDSFFDTEKGFQFDIFTHNGTPELTMRQMGMEFHAVKAS
jgi:CubicO group peptidase (beta-lactamase class C family)